MPAMTPILVKSCVRVLSNLSKGLDPGGTLLFVSHDKSHPPAGWTHKDMESLTTPDEIVSELLDLQI